ncbi:hypothetical protein EWO75_05585 [Salmonella enterica]|uniref:Uncharacterized protein n=1 Tax=Salmonella enterica TaxID=28901 RepID=A0A704QQX5_SALER|nr:hypothetical protein [Salmonella enterica]EAT4613238.1 hypothetical protein [Salmonella enterica]HAC8204772.1 hypothetical protein [Salmonella enterica]HAC8213414.1 hypothetical protein [Salmonella enterica]HAC8227961.1 hypothetical protein [Salmonella enterica]
MIRCSTVSPLTNGKPNFQKTIIFGASSTFCLNCCHSKGLPPIICYTYNTVQILSCDQIWPVLIQ